MRWITLFVVLWTGRLEAGTPFIENQKQWPCDQLFRADVPGGRLSFNEQGISYLLTRQTADKNVIPSVEHAPHGMSKVDLFRYTMQFVNANLVLPHGGHQTDTRYNYFVGNDQTHWAGGVPAYTDLWYDELYDGVSLHAYGEGNQFKYDWVIRAGGNPDAIRWTYAGVSARLDDEGNLLLSTPMGMVIEGHPLAYQVIDGQQVSVRSEFIVSGDRVGFIFPDGFDACADLVIDPLLIFSAYSGSTYDNWGNTATYDQRGNTYTAGITTPDLGGFGYPVTNGSFQTVYQGGDWDIAIMKYDSAGSTLKYATYLGGSATEVPQSLVVDPAGNLLVLGTTGSVDFPHTAGAFAGGENVSPIPGIHYVNGTDLFVAKLKEDGSALLKGTYLGGTGNDGLNFIAGDMLSFRVESPMARNYGDQERGDIITDAAGNVFIASCTRSADFPVVNTAPDATYGGGLLDGVVVALNTDLEVNWTRMMGGTGEDVALSIKVAADGDLVVAGGTTSHNFRGINGVQSTQQGDVDGWIARLASTGTLIRNATYVGTPQYDQVYFIDLGTDGQVYAFGQTSGSYPVQGTVYTNPHSGQFLHKFSGDLTASVFSTVVGSGRFTPDISPTAFLVSDCNTIYIGGWGGILNSPFGGNYVGGSTVGLPTTSDAYQRTSLGNDFYFMALSGDASQFLYGTFLGGSASLTHVDGGTSRFDKRGIVYHAVCAGCGGRSDFPAVNVPVDHQFNNSVNCNNAVFKFDLSLLKARIQTNSVRFNQPGVARVCLGDPLVFQNLSVGGKVFSWDLGDGVKSTLPDTAHFSHIYKTEGSFKVKLLAIDATTCKGRDSTFVTIIVNRPTGKAGPDQTICAGFTELTASGGASYQWFDGQHRPVSTLPVVGVVLADSAHYTVAITDNNGCVVKDTVKVKVLPAADLKFIWNLRYNCAGRPQLHLENQSAKESSVVFDTGDGFLTDADRWAHDFSADGTFVLKATSTRESCVKQELIPLDIHTLQIPNVITPEPVDGANDRFRIKWGEQDLHTTGKSSKLTIANRWGYEVYRSDNYQDDWNARDLAPGTFYYEVTIDSQLPCKGWVQVVK